jgi:hypothetical protein
MARNTCIYNQPGAVSFRRSSSSFTVDILNEIKVGTNLQNIEKEARRLYHSDGYTEALKEKCAMYLQNRDINIFTAEERKKLTIFCQVDQSGAEALIVAYLCRKGNFRDLFTFGVKPHVFVALHLFSKIWEDELNKYASADFKIDINEALHTSIPDLHKLHYWKKLDKIIKDSDNWPAEQRYYYIAKQICHSSNYGIRPPTFALNTLEKSKGRVVIPKEAAEKYLLFYHSLFPEIQEWHREVQRQLETTRIIYNLQGFPREFTGELIDSILKEAYAQAPQSTVACITAKAYVDLQRYIEAHKLLWDILADTHDSYLVQCPIGEEEVCCKTMQSFMNQELVSPRGENFRMKSEAQWGFNWAPLKVKLAPDGSIKTIINPTGLVEARTS